MGKAKVYGATGIPYEYERATHSNLEVLDKERPRQGKSLRKCFGKNTKRVGDCLVWEGDVGGDGYGKMSFFLRHERAHRVAWILHYGDLPAGEVVTHRLNCRTGKLCCNWEHLWLGSQLETAKLERMRQLNGSVPQLPELKVWCKTIHDEGLLDLIDIGAIIDVTEATIRSWIDTIGEKGLSKYIPLKAPPLPSHNAQALDLSGVTEDWRDEFYSKTKQVGQCLEWQGKRDENGYGKFKAFGLRLVAHRAAWSIENGAIEKGKVIRHLCHNPPCVLNEHLAIGTPFDNAQDMKEAGRSLLGHPSLRNRSTDIPKDKWSILLEDSKTMELPAVAEKHSIDYGALKRLVRRQTFLDYLKGFGENSVENSHKH